MQIIQPLCNRVEAAVGSVVPVLLSHAAASLSMQAFYSFVKYIHNTPGINRSCNMAVGLYHAAALVHISFCFSQGLLYPNIDLRIQRIRDVVLFDFV